MESDFQTGKPDRRPRRWWRKKRYWLPLISSTTFFDHGFENFGQHALETIGARDDNWLEIKLAALAEYKNEFQSIR